MENKGIETAEDYKAKGDKYYSEKDYDNAIKNYDIATALDDTNADVYLNRGILYLFKQEYENALECYSKVIDIE